MTESSSRKRASSPPEGHNGDEGPSKRRATDNATMDLKAIKEFVSSEMKLVQKGYSDDPSIKHAGFCALHLQYLLLHLFSCEQDVISNLPNSLRYFGEPDAGRDIKEAYRKEIRHAQSSLTDKVLDFKDMAKSPFAILDQNMEKRFQPVLARLSSSGHTFLPDRTFITIITDALPTSMELLGHYMHEQIVVRLMQKLVTLVQLLNKIQCQLKDRRNIAFHDEGGSKKYPEEFEWKDKSAKVSREEMEDRKDEIDTLYDAYLTLYG